MLRKLNLQTKIVALAMMCVILPTLVILTATYLKSNALGQSVDDKMKKTSMAQLAEMTNNIREGIVQASRAATISACAGVAKNN